jgi:CYTH domain-containing protein
MAREIERKFLVTGTGWRLAPSTRLRQGYLSIHPGRTVRVRSAGDKAFLTIKGMAVGATRLEFEYDRPAGSRYKFPVDETRRELRRYQILRADVAVAPVDDDDLAVIAQVDPR